MTDDASPFYNRTVPTGPTSPPIAAEGLSHLNLTSPAGSHAPVSANPTVPGEITPEPSGQTTDIPGNAETTKGGAILNKILGPIKKFYKPLSDPNTPVGMKVFQGIVLTLGALLYGAAYLAAVAGPILGATLGLIGTGGVGAIAGLAVGGVAGAGAAVILAGLGAGLMLLGGHKVEMKLIAAPAVLSLAIGFWFVVPFAILGGVLGLAKGSEKPHAKNDNKLGDEEITNRNNPIIGDTSIRENPKVVEQNEEQSVIKPHVGELARPEFEEEEEERPLINFRRPRARPIHPNQSESETQAPQSSTAQTNPALNVPPINTNPPPSAPPANP